MSVSHYSTKPGIHYIYGLTDPQANQIRYVGKSTDPKVRLKDHLAGCKGRKTFAQRWLARLIEAGVKPGLVILQECAPDEWEKAEAWWINHLKAEGYRLTNTAPGGFGGTRDEATKAKIAATLKGRPQPQIQTPEARAKAAAANTGKKKKPCSESRRAKVAAAMKRFYSTNTVPEERRRKISEVKMGHAVSEEVRAKLAAHNTGKKASEETKAKMSASQRARNLNRTEEECRQASERVRLSWIKRRKRRFVQGYLFDCL